MKITKWGFLILGIIGLVSCGEDQLSDPEISVDNFSVSVDENPSNGDVIGSVTATTTEGDLTYSLTNVVPDGAIKIDDNSGQISVQDASAFDFESRTEITAEYIASAEGKSEKADITITINDLDEGGGPVEFNIWSGPQITFTKEDESDPALEANQDRLTDLVWITRNNADGGQIYNAVSESEPEKNTSPVGTEWAVGTTANIASLNFTPFRTAVDKPKNAVGTNLVVRLIEDDIYIDITITSWSEGKKGGFAYQRSTPQ